MPHTGAGIALRANRDNYRMSTRYPARRREIRSYGRADYTVDRTEYIRDSNARTLAPVNYTPIPLDRGGYRMNNTGARIEHNEMTHAYRRLRDGST